MANKREETAEQVQLRRFLTSFRNFATFCRDNPVQDIMRLGVTERQGERLRECIATIGPWLEALQREDESNPTDDP